MSNNKKTLLDLYPDIAKEWDYEKNGEKKPSDFSRGSGFEAWWICSICGYKYKMRILSRTEGHGCKFCGRKKATESRNASLLAKTQSLSQAYPLLSLEFDAEKNNGLTPDNVSKGSDKKIYWKCNSGHSWCDTIGHRISGRGCPYCANTKLLEGFNDLQTKNPQLAKEWHPNKNNNLVPNKVLYKSTKKVFWLCPKCNHTYLMSINERQKGNACPYCSGHKIDPSFNSFGALHPELLKEWDYEKNIVSPFSLAQSSRQKVFWLCPHGHSYEATIHNRHSGYGCPICSQEKQTSFPEQALLFYLSKELEVESRYKIKGVEIDIFITSIMVGIEYDGIRFHSSHIAKLREERKNELLSKMGIRLLRIKEIQPRKESFANNDIFYYSFQSPSYKNIDIPIKWIFATLGIKQHVNVDIVRDSPLIEEQYRKTQIENSIIAKHPEFLDEWDFASNGNLNPNFVSYSSNKEYFWKCKNGHSYHASPSHRMRGNLLIYVQVGA